MPRTTWNSQQAGLKETFTLLDPSGNSTPPTRSATHPPTPVLMSTPQQTPVHISLETPEPLSEVQKFAKAIGEIVKTGSPSKPKLREPDTFDGSDSRKLRTFILQCKLNFRDRPDLFQDDKSKVNYVLSYLKGTALDCFESAILDPKEPDWADDFSLFTDELESNFGTYDTVSEAEAEFEGLCMHDSHQATKYFIKFQQLASRVEWGEAALRRQAYNGLAKHIKDDMVHHHKPNTLAGLRKLIQAIDARYWECKGELSHETRTSSNKSDNKSDSTKSDSKSGKSKSKQKDNNSSSTQSKGSSSNPKKSTPDLSSKLGKDGKLMPQERQCRLDNKLCLFCGTSGHVAKDCPKSTSASSKARASSTEQDKSASSGMDAKKD